MEIIFSKKKPYPSVLLPPKQDLHAPPGAQTLDTLIKDLVSLPNPARKGGVYMEYFVSFLVSVVAGIVCYFIGRWLDGNDGDN